MYKLLKTSLCDLWRTGQFAKIDIRTMRRILQRPLAQLAPIIQPASRAQADQDHIDPGRRFAMRIPSSVAEVWIMMVAGAFLISLCFFSGFHRSRRLDVAPSNVASKHLLERAGALQKSRRHH
jgi:hypothetical protein